jgi:hypothetical protein
MRKVGRMMLGADIRFRAVIGQEAETIACNHLKRQAVLIGSIENFSGFVWLL